MFASLTLEEMFEQLLKLNAEKDAQVEYLRKQLDQAMRNNRKAILSTPSVSTPEPTDEEAESCHDSSGEEEGARRPRRRERVKHQAADFRVEIPEFEG